MYESAAGVKRFFPVLAAIGGNSFPFARVMPAVGRGVPRGVTAFFS
jgi:hypothetical protein